MLRVVGAIYKNGQHVGFMVFSEETLESCAMSTDAVFRLISNNTLFRNVFLKNGAISCTDMPIDLLPAYDSNGAYAESRASFIIVAYKEGSYIVLTNQFTLETTSAEKLIALLKLDSKYVRNVVLSNNKLQFRTRNAICIIDTAAHTSTANPLKQQLASVVSKHNTIKNNSTNHISYEAVRLAFYKMLYANASALISNAYETYIGTELEFGNFRFYVYKESESECTNGLAFSIMCYIGDKTDDSYLDEVLASDMFYLSTGNRFLDITAIDEILQSQYNEVVTALAI